jgi:hypothetical protein
MSTGFQALAVLSTGIYFCGLTYFKLAAADMPTLQGDRPWQLARALLGSRPWLAGAVFLGVGAIVQTAALTGLTLFQAQPMFLAGLALLLVLAILILRERLSLREWGCVLILGGATFLFAHAAPPVKGDSSVVAVWPEAAVVVAVAVPSVLLPCLGFLTTDLDRKGVHARPLTGVALAINVGILTGTAETMLTGAAGAEPPLGLVTEPYLYVFALTAPLALGQLQIALQRGRLLIVGLVATATAKTYLLTVGTLLYSQHWPDDGGLTIMALALSVLALAAVPRHERSAAPVRLHHLPFAR